MTKAKHSPGPWRVELGHQNRIIYGTDSDGDSTVIAEVHWWIADGAAESEANARLIAAAPSLLAAMKAMLAANDQGVAAVRAARPDQIGRVSAQQADMFSITIEPCRAAVRIAESGK